METRQTTDLKIVGSTPAKLVFLIKVKSETIEYTYKSIYIFHSGVYI